MSDRRKGAVSSVRSGAGARPRWPESACCRWPCGLGLMPQLDIRHGFAFMGTNMRPIQRELGFTILEQLGEDGEFAYPAPPIRSEIGHFRHPESLADAAEDVQEMARRGGGTQPRSWHRWPVPPDSLPRRKSHGMTVSRPPYGRVWVWTLAVLLAGSGLCGCTDDGPRNVDALRLEVLHDPDGSSVRRRST